jgi:hypothetical protein
MYQASISSIESVSLYYSSVVAIKSFISLNENSAGSSYFLFKFNYKGYIYKLIFFLTLKSYATFLFDYFKMFS